MPKKINLVMKQLGAAEFGVLLKDGEIVSVRAGKAVIKYTKSVRGKKNTEVYHVNLQPHMVHQEVEEEETVAAEKPARKKPGPKPKAKMVTKRGKTARKKPGPKPKAKPADAAEKPPRKKPGPKPKAKPAEVEGAEKPPRKKPGPKPKAKVEKTVRKRKARVKPEVPEIEVEAETDTPTAEKPVKKTAPAHIPWSENLGDDEFEV